MQMLKINQQRSFTIILQNGMDMAEGSGCCLSLISGLAYGVGYIWLIKLIAMSKADYKTTHPDRINPQFPGVAGKFSTAKRRRLSLEQHRNQLLSNLNYKITINEKLEQSLQQKRSELRTVQSVHHRHLTDLQIKRQEEERKRQEMIRLNKEIQERRDEDKRSTREAVIRTQNRNRKEKEKVSIFHEHLREEMKSAELNRLGEKRAKFREGKYEQREGRKTFDHFFKQKNTASLNNYKEMIKSEHDKAIDYKRQIVTISSSIDKYDKIIDTKKSSLCQVLDKISLFTSESPEAQSKCLPLYLRSTLTTSHSSRPSDLLLKGPQAIIFKQENLYLTNT